MVTWREEIGEARKNAGDAGEIIACTLSSEEMDERFDSGYGVEEGRPFTAWTATRVYFPVCYDGAEWVSSAPRDPCSEAMTHVGGG